MAGIHVLSDILKGGNKPEKISTSKGTELSGSPNSVAKVFATLLSGSMNSNVDSKGQNSKAAQDLEEKQSASVQNPNEQGSMLGYASFALLNSFQPMLQSDFPAGKEANSGNDVSQRIGDLAVANAPVVSGDIQLALLNLVSLASDEVSAQSGMTTSNPQGVNPSVTELDKYRLVITNLLIALSGEITDPSLEGNRLSQNSPGTMDLRQEMAKLVQGWLLMAEDAGEETSGVVNGQKGMQPLLEALAAGIGSGESALNAKVSTLLAALYPKLSQGNEEAEGTKAAQGMKAMNLDKGDIIDAVTKDGSETFLKQLKGTDSKPVASRAVDNAPLTNVQLKSEGMSTKKGDSTQSVETFGGKDVQSQNSSASVGALSNIITANVADGKTVAVPVWAQISSVIREQVMNPSQDLKQLEIQLHPADLGRIQIGMRWENGQVHLIVQASEATTGQLLQNQLSDLRHNLTNQGVNCGMLQMGQGGERQQNPRGDESQRTFHQDTSQNEGEEENSVSNTLSLEQDGINRINVKA